MERKHEPLRFKKQKKHKNKIDKIRLQSLFFVKKKYIYIYTYIGKYQRT